MKYSLRAASAALALVVPTIGLTSCAAEPKATAEPTAKGASAPLFDELPAEHQTSKVIRVGSDVAYAPMEYYDSDGETILGFDKELSDLLAEQLGVAFEWNNGTFDGLITQLKSRRFDIVMSGMSDTPERQAEVDFVDYYRAGAMILVRKGNPEKIQALADLCGKTIAVQRGSTQEGYAKDQSAACDEPIEILSFDRETEAMLQVKNGRAVAGLQDYPVATYNARTAGGGNDFEVVGDQIDAGPLGIAVTKDNAELRDAMQKAIQAVISDGSYGRLIEKYETPLGAIETATINGAT